MIMSNKKCLVMLIKNRINHLYGMIVTFDNRKTDIREISSKIQKEIDDLIYIRNFIEFLNRGSFDKRFLEFMFSRDLAMSNIDTTRLTNEICDLIVKSRKLFPKRIIPRSAWSITIKGDKE